VKKREKRGKNAKKVKVGDFEQALRVTRLPTKPTIVSHWHGVTLISVSLILIEAARVLP
jgi:hypothetical protein